MQAATGRGSQLSCAPAGALRPSGGAASPKDRHTGLARRCHTTPAGRGHRRPAATADQPWTQLLNPVRLVKELAAPQKEAEAEEVAEAEQAAASPQAQMVQVEEVYENQRYYGLAWKPPLSVLDWPEWSDEEGRAVELQQRPADDPAGWQLAVTPATDEAGWQYATVFKHLQYKRAGGRSTPRWGDTVRRRLWCRRSGTQAAPAVVMPEEAEGSTAAAAAAAAVAAVEEGGNAAAALAAAAAARAARDAESKKKAVKAFLQMVLDLLSRRQLWTLVPWDPAAVFLLYQKHQQVYAELQAQAYERRLFAADQEAPPSVLSDGRTLLQDLLCAAMHSRAAYGFPMQQGYISDVGAYIRLQTVQPLTFDAVGGVSVEANNEALAGLAGIDVGDLLLAEWTNSPFRPCHYVAIDRANQCIVLSIRGSLQVGDLLSDLVAAPMEVDVGGASGWVHQGIFAAATFIHCNTQDALAEAARRCPGWPLLVTGHSLGGGVAALVTLLLQETGLPPGVGPMHCVTIGTAAVMSRPLAEACNQRVTSVILGQDVVPHLSLASVETLLLEASKESPVRQTIEGWGNKLAGALNLSVAKRQELQDAASAALTAGKISGSWSAVKDASVRLGRTASSKGLAKVVSLVKSNNGNQQGARQIPVLREQPAPVQQQLQARQQPRQISVIDMSQPTPQQQQQQAAAPALQVDAAEAAASMPGMNGDTEAEPAVLLPYHDFDTPMAEAALAQETAAEEAGRAVGAGVSSSTASGSLGSPEWLFPPGRLIWIFPNGREGEGQEAQQEQAEQQLQAMDAAWQGLPDAPEGQPPERPAAGTRAAQGSGDAGSTQCASGSGRARDIIRGGGGSVNMAEAVEAVESGTSHTDVDAASGSSAGNSSNGDATRRPPVVVDADRGSFERLLLLPSMLDDHLPDGYLRALQEL